MKQLSTLVLGLVLTGAQAQINGYARITAIADSSLTIGASSEAGAPFLVGKQVVLMQMQDDVIGGNTGNNAAFGDLGSIQQAGRYEVRTIVSVARDVFGAPIGLVLDNPPTVAFNTGPNSRVQAITFELLGGGGDYTTVSNINALPWNGDLGGVVAFEVEGTFTLAHSVTADAAGFRGGTRDLSSAGSCDVTTYRAAVGNRYAGKGEGIYLNTNTNWVEAKGKILNGGGGGNDHNGGGGGGGNYTAGGLAGPGWNCGAGHAGGLGGISLSGHIAVDRVFMGGGGGGGEGNNNVSTDGGRGGGVILIKADTLRSSGSCSGLRISADGGSVSNAGNDGSGGGGAGGAIVFEVDQFDVAASCPLTVRANGGDGGRVGSPNVHGGGGGGGQGVVIFSSTLPTSNITIQTNNGSGGCNNTSNPCNSQAEDGLGANGGGIFGGSSGPLPIELLSFQAIPVHDRVDLMWITASEIDNAFFTVERSIDGETWEALLHLPGAGTSFHQLDYRASDDAPLPGLSYYRLGQTDHDGTTTVHDRVAVRFQAASDALEAFPNPATAIVTLVHGEVGTDATLFLLDGLGRQQVVPMTRLGNRMELDVRYLPAGQYTAVLQDARMTRHARLVVGH
ncbi:MAG: T9SS type A sorting domain-containing protein [Flavobacteriales bacterium]|nr:T9SS type A sorting domain-containing protein [Flavobacteriales bacterium]